MYQGRTDGVAAPGFNYEIGDHLAEVVSPGAFRTSFHAVDGTSQVRFALGGLDVSFWTRLVAGMVAIFTQGDVSFTFRILSRNIDEFGVLCDISPDHPSVDDIEWDGKYYLTFAGMGVNVDPGLSSDMEYTVPNVAAIKDYVTAVISSFRSEILGGADAAWDTFAELKAFMLADESTATALATLVGQKAPSLNPAFTGIVDMTGVTRLDVTTIYPGAALLPYTGFGSRPNLGASGSNDWWGNLYVEAGVYVSGNKVIGARATNIPNAPTSFAGADTVDASAIASMASTVNNILAMAQTHGFMA